MTALRWILIVAGLVVIAAIYVVGRRNRRTSASDAAQSMRETHVPQLDQPVRQRERADPPLTITSLDTRMDGGLMDDLPPMHASDPVEKVSMQAAVLPKTSVLTPMSTSYEPVFNEPPATGMSTGAFIAAQSREPVTRKIYQQTAEESMPDQGVITPNPSERIDSMNVAAPAQTISRPAKKPATRKIVALRLSAGSERVEGSRLKSLMEAAGLCHGKYSIYHRLHNGESPLFSVASMVEPGTFDPQAMSGTQFPGVTIFTQLPGPIDSGEMLTQMLSCARELEQGIGGLLQDERGLPLTEQRAQRLREDVADFTHLLGLS